MSAENPIKCPGCGSGKHIFRPRIVITESGKRVWKGLDQRYCSDCDLTFNPGPGGPKIWTGNQVIEV